MIILTFRALAVVIDHIQNASLSRLYIGASEKGENEELHILPILYSLCVCDSASRLYFVS